MKRVLVITTVVLLTFAACNREKQAGDVRQVSAPPTTPPATGEANDTALTQTVEIGDNDRPADEGGVLTNGSSTAKGATGTITVPGAAGATGKVVPATPTATAPNP